MKIVKVDPNLSDAAALMEELSQNLKSITGSSGKSSFDLKDVCVPRALFVIAYDENGRAIGCGAFRPVTDKIAEVKRMYARIKENGIGTKILEYLEAQAKQLNYKRFYVETRLINQKAVNFYRNRGYVRIPNYGRYSGNAEAICFEKQLL